MKVIIIGAGNVATHIAKALKAVNIVVAQIWSYHYENASQLANEVNAVAVKDLVELDVNADLCLIAVKDDAIKDIVKNLISFKGLIAHTAGAVNIDVFKDTIASYGVFYPLQTFSKTKAVDFSNIPLCLEANNEHTLAILKEFARKISSNVVEINSEKRKILHLAAVFACNFTNHMYTLANEILIANDLPFEIIRPLIAETANKIEQALPPTVQTGPAIRQDIETLKKHEELLEKQPELLKIYKTLSESIKKTR